MPFIEHEIKTGEAVQAGDMTITPLTRVLKVQIPGHNAGLVWNRPKAVVVRTAEGEQRSLPIVDVTRLAIWTILAGGFLGAILVGMIYQRKRVL